MTAFIELSDPAIIGARQQPVSETETTTHPESYYVASRMTPSIELIDPAIIYAKQRTVSDGAIKYHAQQQIEDVYPALLYIGKGGPGKLPARQDRELEDEVDAIVNATAPISRKPVAAADPMRRRTRSVPPISTTRFEQGGEFFEATYPDSAVSWDGEVFKDTESQEVEVNEAQESRTGSVHSAGGSSERSTTSLEASTSNASTATSGARVAPHVRQAMVVKNGIAMVQGVVDGKEALRFIL